MKIRIEKDNITPYLRALEKKTKGTEIRSFLGRQFLVLRKNINENFHRKEYRTASGMKKWAPLMDSTEKRRKRAGTWRGNQSILFETGRMWSSAWSDRRVSARSGVYSLSVGPSASERHKFRKHQYTGVGKKGTIRPPYSIRLSTERLLMKKTMKYFLG